MIEDKYLSKSKRLGQIHVFPYEETLNIITDCKHENVDILGLDGFYIGTDYTVPLQEYSVDFTSNTVNRMAISVWDLAEKFVKGNPKDIFYEIVLGTEQSGEQSGDGSLID